MSTKAGHATRGYLFREHDPMTEEFQRVGLLLTHPAVYPDGVSGKTAVPKDVTLESHQVLFDGVLLARTPQADHTGAIEVVQSASKSVSVYDAFVVPIEHHSSAARHRIETIAKPIALETLQEFTVGKDRVATNGHGVVDIVSHSASKLGVPQSHFHEVFYNLGWNDQKQEVQCVRNFREALFHHAPVMEAQFQKRLADEFVAKGVEVELRDNMCHVKAIPKELCDALSPNKQFIDLGKQLGRAPDTPAGNQYLNYIGRELKELGLAIPKNATVNEAAQVRVEAVRATCEKLGIDPVALKKTLETPTPGLGPKNGFQDREESYNVVAAITKTITVPKTIKELQAYVITQSVNFPKTTLAEIERQIQSVVIRAGKEKDPDALDKIKLTYSAPPGSPIVAVETVEKFAPRHVIDKVKEQEPTRKVDEPKVEREKSSGQEKRRPEPEPERERTHSDEKAKQKSERQHTRTKPDEKAKPEPKTENRYAKVTKVVNAWKEYFKNIFRSPVQTRHLLAGAEVHHFIERYHPQSIPRSHANAFKAMVKHLFRINNPHEVAKHGEKVFDENRSHKRVREKTAIVVHNPNGRLTQDDRFFLEKIAKRDGAKIEYVEPTVSRKPDIEVTPIKEPKPKPQTNRTLPPPPSQGH